VGGKTEANPHAIVHLHSCGLGQLKLSGRKNIQGIKLKGKQTGTTIIS
jgi:hypothetical protein